MPGRNYPWSSMGRASGVPYAASGANVNHEFFGAPVQTPDLVPHEAAPTFIPAHRLATPAFDAAFPAPRVHTPTFEDDGEDRSAATTRSSSHHRAPPVAVPQFDAEEEQAADDGAASVTSSATTRSDFVAGGSRSRALGTSGPAWKRPLAAAPRPESSAASSVVGGAATAPTDRPRVLADGKSAVQPSSASRTRLWAADGHAAPPRAPVTPVERVSPAASIASVSPALSAVPSGTSRAANPPASRQSALVSSRRSSATTLDSALTPPYGSVAHSGAASDSGVPTGATRAARDAPTNARRGTLPPEEGATHRDAATSSTPPDPEREASVEAVYVDVEEVPPESEPSPAPTLREHSQTRLVNRGVSTEPDDSPASRRGAQPSPARAVVMAAAPSPAPASSQRAEPVQPWVPPPRSERRAVATVLFSDLNAVQEMEELYPAGGVNPPPAMEEERERRSGFRRTQGSTRSGTVASTVATESIVAPAVLSTLQCSRTASAVVEEVTADEPPTPNDTADASDAEKGRPPATLADDEDDAVPPPPHRYEILEPPAEGTADPEPVRTGETSAAGEAASPTPPIEQRKTGDDDAPKPASNSVETEAREVPAAEAHADEPAAPPPPPRQAHTPSSAASATSTSPPPEASLPPRRAQQPQPAGEPGSLRSLMNDVHAVPRIRPAGSASRLARVESNETFERRGIQLNEEYDRTDIIATAHRVRALLSASWPLMP